MSVTNAKPLGSRYEQDSKNKLPFNSKIGKSFPQDIPFSKKLSPLKHQPLYPYLGMLTQLVKSSSGTYNKIAQSSSTRFDPSSYTTIKRPSYQLNFESTSGTTKGLPKMNYADLLLYNYHSHNYETKKSPALNESVEKLPKIKTPAESILGQTGLIIRKMQVMDTKQKVTKRGKLVNISTQGAETTKAKKDLASYMLVLSSNKYKFIVYKGNNSGLIKEAMLARQWWIELPFISPTFNFKWQPVSFGIKFATLNTAGLPQMVNHFESHSNLSHKSLLYLNLQSFSEQVKENVFDYLPITFYIELSHSNPKTSIASVLHNFATLHKLLESASLVATQLHSLPVADRMPINSPKSTMLEKLANSLSPLGTDRKTGLVHTKFTMPLCHFAGHNLWILKPTGLNRGKGIHVFRDLESLKDLIKRYLPKKKLGKTDNGEGGETAKKEVGSIRATTFIIQKYIEMPLLIHNRKFDIRMWVLVTHEMDCYLFKEGYIRTSSTPFVINLDDVDNKFVHLTNNAIQKYGKDYGKFEDGNQMSFPQFQQYIEAVYADKKVSMEADILPQIKNLVRKTMFATKKKLNSENRKHTFELFGYDFIIDVDFNVWLIEVNTNPCLEESSALLKMFLPRMIDDALKLTVDVIFPPLPMYQSSARKTYHVAGYDDQENMWELICGANELINTSERVSLRSELVWVADDIRRVKVKKYNSKDKV